MSAPRSSGWSSPRCPLRTPPGGVRRRARSALLQVEFAAMHRSALLQVEFAAVPAPRSRSPRRFRALPRRGAVLRRSLRAPKHQRSIRTRARPGNYLRSALHSTQARSALLFSAVEREAHPSACGRAGRGAEGDDSRRARRLILAEGQNPAGVLCSRHTVRTERGASGAVLVEGAVEVSKQGPRQHLWIWCRSVLGRSGGGASQFMLW